MPRTSLVRLENNSYVFCYGKKCKFFQPSSKDNHSFSNFSFCLGNKKRKELCQLTYESNCNCPLFKEK